MKKTICDICGHDTKGFHQKFDRYSQDNAITITGLDVCAVCAKELRGFVRDIQKLNNMPVIPVLDFETEVLKYGNHKT